MKPEQFIREYGAEKAREEFEKKLKCQDLLSELTFCEKTSSYEGDILPTNLATINGAYWAWVKRQAEMDEQQAKVEELQRRNQMLNDNIKEQGQKLVYQNEVIETQAEKLLGLRDEKAELQKRMDKAIRFLVEAELYQSEPNIDLAVKALKGEGQ